MIPRVLHRIWVGGRPIPERFETWWARFGELNPGWVRRTWRDADVAQIRLRCCREYRAARTLAGKADVLRYEILASAGGVYVDADTEPLRPFGGIGPLIGDRTAWACLESPGWIANGAMGAAAGHPAVLALLKALPASFRLNRGGPVHQTGPGLLTRTWLNRDDVAILEPIYFYPVHWTRKAELGGPYPPDSFAVQHWAASWQEPGPDRVRRGPQASGRQEH